MAAKLHNVAAVNGFSTTLNGAIAGSDTTITLTSTTNLPSGGGILVLDRINASGASTEETREYISYTGVAGSTITGATRGVANSTAQAHSSGAIVEEVWSVTHVLDLISFLNVSHASNGTMIDSLPLTNPELNTSVSGTAFLDEDDLSSNSASKLASQQSIKAYVDSKALTRTTTEVSSATPTINTDNTDIHTITALATDITSFTTNLSGTPVNGQKLIIRILDDGTARAITWGASFAARGVDLPTTTTLSKYQYNGFIYNSTTSTWDLVASVDES